MVNIPDINHCNFVETPGKFIIAKLPIRKLGSSSVLVMPLLLSSLLALHHEDPSLRIESFAMGNSRGVSTQL